MIRGFVYRNVDGVEIIVTPRRNSRSVRLRRCAGGELKASVPYGIDEDVARDIIGRLLDKLSAMPSAELPGYRAGQEIQCDEFCIRIVEDPRVAGCRIDVAWPMVYVKYNSQGFDTPMRMNRAVDRAVMAIAKVAAERYVLPKAEAIACELGCKPKEWKVGYGKQRLGSCRTDGRIVLSGVLAFMPQELRMYVICHELAHLTHMDHSPRFHSLLDEYLGGRERELSLKVKRFMRERPNGNVRYF